MKQLAFSPSDLPYKLLVFGIDTLFLNVRYGSKPGAKTATELPEVLVDRFNGWQERAKAEEGPVPVPLIFRGANLLIHAHGAGKGRWRWLLTCEDFNLTLSRGRLGGIIAQVRLSSRLLWSALDSVTHRQDVWPLLEEINTFLYEVLAVDGLRLDLQVSEVHLCADVAGWDLEHCFDWQVTMLTRARRRRPHGSYTPPDLGEDCKQHGCKVEGSFLWQGPEESIPEPVYMGHHLETIEFGSHGSALSAVIYNKSREIKKSGKAWVPDIWKRNGYDGQGDVWRVEGRWTREALHDTKQEGVFHGIETLADLRRHLSDLWTYFVGHLSGGQDGFPDGWLRYVAPSADSNPARWPVHPAWAVVQGAFCVETEPAVNIQTGEVVELPRSPMAVLIRERKRQRDVQRLVQQIAGCMATLACHLGGREQDCMVDLSADTVDDVVPMPEHLPDFDLALLLEWLSEHTAFYALKKRLPPGAPAWLLQQEYATQFAETIEEKRILYHLQSTEE